jgi:hypothetical protein
MSDWVIYIRAGHPDLGPELSDYKAGHDGDCQQFTNPGFARFWLSATNIATKRSYRTIILNHFFEGKIW